MLAGIARNFAREMREKAQRRAQKEHIAQYTMLILNAGLSAQFKFDDGGTIYSTLLKAQEKESAPQKPQDIQESIISRFMAAYETAKAKAEAQRNE